MSCARCGLVTDNMQRICCRQAAARPPPVPSLLPITSSAAGFRAAEPLEQGSWRTSAPVRTSPCKHMRKQNTSYQLFPAKTLLILMQCLCQAAVQTSQPPAAAWFLQTTPPTILTSPTATTPSVLCRPCSSSRSRPFKSRVRGSIAHTNKNALMITCES